MKHRSSANNEKGAALIFVMIGLALLTLVGIAMTFQASTDYNISNNFVTSQQALAIADGGINAGKAYLKGKDFSTVLAKTTDVPAYTSESQPAEGTLLARNPITRLAARTAKFDGYSTTQGAGALPVLGGVTQALSGSKWVVKGYIGQPGGTPLGDGLFFAKLTDNNDEVGVQNYNVDSDDKVFLRSIGVHQTFKSDKASTSGKTQASVAVLEVLLKRDMSFNIKSPFALEGENVGANFSGNSFNIDGRNYNGMTPAQARSGANGSWAGAVPGIGTMFSGGNGLADESIKGSLANNQNNNIVGTDGNGLPATPSVVDTTSVVASGGDSAHVLDPNWVGNFLSLVKGIADYNYAGGTSLTGSGVQLGTEADPKITYVDGDLHVSGSGGGSGVLIVKGNLDYQGSFDYTGVIIVLGGNLDMGGANKSIVGGLFLADLQKSGSNYSWGVPNFNIHGNSNFYFRSDSIKLGWSLLPLKVLSWREVPPELDKN